MQFIATFLVLSILGFIDSLYLTYKHFQKKPLICPIGSDCNAVVESKWGNIFGIRNEFLGIVFYISMFSGGLILVYLPNLVSNLMFYIQIATGMSLIFSLFLTWLQFSVIKNFCFYCLLSATITLLLFINAFFL